MAVNRLDLLAVEVEEIGDQVQHTLFLALVLTVFSVLTGLTLTAALALVLWSFGPVIVLTVIGCAWALVAFLLHRCLFGSLRRWRPFAASLDQIRKDRKFVMEHLS